MPNQEYKMAKAIATELEELRQYKKETLWRITEDDIHDLLVESDIPQDKWAEWYELFKRKFTVPDWIEQAGIFIDLSK